mmetsp:Transcript_52550/g.52915  ORF Transcript_52550/g.52915 Transcript_52550/m.52915 type:complete len:90 (-) Transcript_52550:138-407(-)
MVGKGGRQRAGGSRAEELDEIFRSPNRRSKLNPSKNLKRWYQNPYRSGQGGIDTLVGDPDPASDVAEFAFSGDITLHLIPRGSVEDVMD